MIIILLDINFGDKRTGSCITTHSLTFHFFTREFLTKDNMTVVPTHPTFSRLRIKLKRRNFYTIEVIEAESQAVLNALTEHDFHDAFKNGRSETAHAR
jgi:hypothetical protein